MTEFLNVINAVFYVVSNVLIVYIAVGVIAFVIGYYALFDPSATTAGKMIFRFFLSLVGIIGLVFIGTFIDPAVNRTWWQLPPDVEPWRPLIRFVVYVYVAFTITSLAVLLWLRKYRPHRIKAAPDVDLVKVRHDTDEVRIIPPTVGPSGPAK